MRLAETLAKPGAAASWGRRTTRDSMRVVRAASVRQCAVIRPERSMTPWRRWQILGPQIPSLDNYDNVNRGVQTFSRNSSDCAKVDGAHSPAVIC